jgi:HSP20 family protein
MTDREKKSIARWNPFDDERGWFPSFARPHGDFMDAFWDSFRDHRGESKRFLPATDITEDDGHYVVTAELPGMKREDVTVEVCDHMLTIRGEKKSEREEKTEKRRYVERSFGTFSRAFTLPSDASEERVQASFKDGVLTVTLDKIAEKKARTVDVKVA